MYQILQFSRMHKACRGTNRHRIVIRQLNYPPKTEFVVHTQVFVNPNDTTFFVFGNYFTDILEAAVCFRKRTDHLEETYKEFLE